MKHLLADAKGLKAAGRWDIDFHLPPQGITKYPPGLLHPVRECADIIKTKRDPTRIPEKAFLYIDIASIDVSTGVITTPQELTGEEAPSRARKVVHAYDLIVSTCRPTRGAIAVIPEELHGQICSTGFSVLRVKDGTNPFYLQFVLRLESTLEQFRKWSTGSSYPAILDEDVAKTLVPVPPTDAQDLVARAIRYAGAIRDRRIREVGREWKRTLEGVIASLEKGSAPPPMHDRESVLYASADIAKRISTLPPVEEEAISAEDEILEQSLFEQNGGNSETS